MTALLLLSVLARQDAPSSTPGTLVTKMLARYFNAQTVEGRTETQVVVGNDRLSIVTEFAIARPNRVYIKQTVSGALSRVCLVTCDGKEVSYDTPLNGVGFEPGTASRLVEPVGDMKVGDIYGLLAFSIAERSIALDLAFARPDDLRMLKGQWATLEEVEGRDVPEGARTVAGSWRDRLEEPVSGTYELVISPEGDLVSYLITLNPDPKLPATARRLTARLTIGAEIPDSRFFVVK